MTKTISSRTLCKSYKGRAVVASVNLDVSMGEVVGLLGPNGAGKTTTFYMIVGLIKPDSGKVSIDSRDITPLPVYRRARLGVGYHTGGVHDDLRDLDAPEKGLFLNMTAKF